MISLKIKEGKKGIEFSWDLEEGMVKYLGWAEAGSVEVSVHCCGRGWERDDQHFGKTPGLLTND